MSSSVPIVSVTLLAHNHEKFVGEAIRSVLSQTFADLELVVVDDGSTDATARVIASFDDPRLVSIRQENQGPSAAANRALRACRGRYIALMSGDDVCHADRLARQLDEYQRGDTRLLFSSVDLIDDEGRPLTKTSFCDGLFDRRPGGRAAIYRHFFHAGNFVNAITCFTETEVFRKVGFCNPLLLQLQDYDLWIRFIKRYEFTFLSHPILSYRVRGDGQNLSAPDASRSVRSTNELYFIMRRFFDDVCPKLFREAFQDELLRPDCTHPAAIPCEQAFLLVREFTAPHQLAGIEKLRELFEDPETAAILRTEYQFDRLAFSHLLGKSDAFNSLTDNRSTLYLDLGSGFNENDVCRASINLLSRKFDITFDLDTAPTVQQLRWDPYEGRLGRVHVNEIVWKAPDDRQGEVDVSTISSNGVREEGDVYNFETLDPSILIPFTGQLSRLTVRGRWDVPPSESMRIRYMSLLSERDALRTELARRQAELSLRENQLHSILTSRRWRIAEKIHSIGQLLRGRRTA